VLEYMSDEWCAALADFHATDRNCTDAGFEEMADMLKPNWGCDDTGSCTPMTKADLAPDLQLFMCQPCAQNYVKIGTGGDSDYEWPATTEQCAAVVAFEEQCAQDGWATFADCGFSTNATRSCCTPFPDCIISTYKEQCQ